MKKILVIVVAVALACAVAVGAIWYYNTFILPSQLISEMDYIEVTLSDGEVNVYELDPERIEYKTEFALRKGYHDGKLVMKNGEVLDVSICNISNDIFVDGYDGYYRINAE